VAAVPNWIWALLTVPVLGCPVCEWLCGDLDLDSADGACPWLSSQ